MNLQRPHMETNHKNCAAATRAANLAGQSALRPRSPTSPTKPVSNTTGGILIVDDTPANLQVLTGMLKERGYKVRPVPSGKLALLAARSEAPDLILLDINMPDMNGYQVCEQLKGDEKLRGVPVIFISALTEQLDKVMAFSLGGVDYITKPFQMEELHARVATHLKLHRLQRELEASNVRLAQVNERMSRDLRAAAKIQETFLPHAMPRIEGTDFAWVYRPCDELAGDGLNIIPLGDGQFGMYVLDVSGHGVASALLSVTMSRLLSLPSDPSSILITEGPGREGRGITPPADVAARLNRLFPFDAAEQLTTMIYGILDTRTGIFRYVSAGHPGPIRLSTGADPIVLESQGFPLGLTDDQHEERSVRLRPGDRLYLYSDGVPEAMDLSGEQFGSERLLKVITEERSRPLQASVTTLLGEVTRWRGSESPQDDVSILAVEFSATASAGNRGVQSSEECAT
jgi:sigma-B regulation protein RsbU (phosphoserine phosphatase)